MILFSQNIIKILKKKQKFIIKKINKNIKKNSLWRKYIYNKFIFEGLDLQLWICLKENVWGCLAESKRPRIAKLDGCT